jgi:hypothetical protein
MQTTEYSGGCSCGAVRYQASVAPQFSFHCQCRQCQQATGTGHASLFVVPVDAVSLSGELRFYEQTADDGNTVSRGFCPRCGSPVVGKSSGHPDIMLFAAASLDNPALFKPEKVVWSASRQPWDYTDPDLPVS